MFTKVAFGVRNAGFNYMAVVVACDKLLDGFGGGFCDITGLASATFVPKHEQCKRSDTSSNLSLTKLSDEDIVRE